MTGRAIKIAKIAGYSRGFVLLFPPAAIRILLYRVQAVCYMAILLRLCGAAACTLCHFSVFSVFGRRRAIRSVSSVPLRQGSCGALAAGLRRADCGELLSCKLAASESCAARTVSLRAGAERAGCWMGTS